MKKIFIQSMTDKITHWVDLSENDVRVAEDLLRLKHYLQASFFCHLAVEKIFKACYTKLKKGTPPFRHELDLLAKRSEFYDLLSEEQKHFLDILDPFNIEARYPEYKSFLAQSLTQSRCEYLLQETKNLLQWTKEEILSKK